MKVKLEGVFVVKSIGDEYIEMDAYETGNTDTFERRNEQEILELEHGENIYVGNFFKVGGEYETERTNEVFTKVAINGQLYSFPNHKIIEVK